MRKAKKLAIDTKIHKFFSYPHEKKSLNRVIISSNFHKNGTRIVDSLLMTKFWISLIFIDSDSGWLISYPCTRMNENSLISYLYELKICNVYWACQIKEINLSVFFSNVSVVCNLKTFLWGLISNLMCKYLRMLTFICLCMM